MQTTKKKPARYGQSPKKKSVARTKNRSQANKKALHTKTKSVPASVTKSHTQSNAKNNIIPVSSSQVANPSLSEEQATTLPVSAVASLREVSSQSTSLINVSDEPTSFREVSNQSTSLRKSSDTPLSGLQQLNLSVPDMPLANPSLSTDQSVNMSIPSAQGANCHPQKAPKKPPTPRKKASRARTAPAGADSGMQEDVVAASVKPLSEQEALPTSWVWPGHIPIGEVTPLEGDLQVGKTTLAYDLADRVASGKPMLDGTTGIAGNVLIVTPNAGAATAIRNTFIGLGTDLSRICVLSYAEKEATTPPADDSQSTRRPFRLPEDLPLLRQTMRQMQARLVIFDQFPSMLSTGAGTKPLPQTQLHSLLSQLHTIMFEEQAACLIIRHAPPNSSRVRPSALERSEHFRTIAASRLLLARDPLNPECIVLTHAASTLSPLAPSLSFRIKASTSGPHHLRIVSIAPHHLVAEQFFTHRPTSLRLLLLTQLITDLVEAMTEPFTRRTILAACPQASTYQVGRILRTLMDEGTVIRLARGIYATPQVAAAQATTRKEVRMAV